MDRQRPTSAINADASAEASVCTGNAAQRAECAAGRAESAADRIDVAAVRAEKAAERTEAIVDKMVAQNARRHRSRQ